MALRPGPGSVRPSWTYRVRQWLWAGADLVFTPTCAGCERRGERLCGACRAAVRRLGPHVCDECGYPLSASGECHSGWHPLTGLRGVRSAAYFEGPLQHALHRLKYKRDILLADSLAPELLAAWTDYALPAGTVAPVPLSAERQRERGYNQAALLARAFADLAGLPYEPAAARRVRHTDTQVRLPAEARRRNVEGAFRGLPERVAGRTILLVDDVSTTGATLAACADALTAAGAAVVWGLTLGRAVGHAAGSTAAGRPVASRVGAAGSGRLQA